MNIDELAIGLIRGIDLVTVREVFEFLDLRTDRDIDG